MNITWYVLGIFCLILFLSFPYMQVEALTYTKRDDLDSYIVYCDFPPKYIKVSEFNRAKEDLEIFCIHPNPDESEIVSLNYRKENWEVIRRKKMYSGSPTWPWYL